MDTRAPYPQLPFECPCIGCGLCESVCPHGAIRMEEDAKGFISPKVDADACVECHVCEKMCAKQAGNTTKGTVLACYEAWNTDEAIRMESSSGGVFTALAGAVLAQGGVVVGVQWSGRASASYAVARNSAELSAMRKSKYIQAGTAGLIKRIRQELDAGRMVLFTGLPCHARAVRTRFGWKQDKLLIVDIACYGVPSRNLLRSYLAELEKTAGEDVLHYECRDKGHGWRAYRSRLIFASGRQQTIPAAENRFQEGFCVTGLALGENCYTCDLELGKRFSDISIGDYWGRGADAEADRLGVSSVACLTPAGAAFVQQLSGKGRLHISPIAEEDVLRNNKGFTRTPRAVPALRPMYLEYLRGHALDEVRRKFTMPDRSVRPHVRFAGKVWLLPVVFSYPRRFWRKLRRMLSRR